MMIRSTAAFAALLASSAEARCGTSGYGTRPCANNPLATCSDCGPSPCEDINNYCWSCAGSDDKCYPYDCGTYCSTAPCQSAEDVQVQRQPPSTKNDTTLFQPPTDDFAEQAATLIADKADEAAGAQLASQSTMCTSGSTCNGASCKATMNGMTYCCLGSSCSMSMKNGVCTCGQGDNNVNNSAPTQEVAAVLNKLGGEEASRPVVLGQNHELHSIVDGNTTDTAGCDFGSSQERMSSYSFTSWTCRSWPNVDQADWRLTWRSMNNDKLKISTGWCSSSCTGSYRSSSCYWGSERSSSDNFEHTLRDTVRNSNFRDPVACTQIKCDNWAESCQVKLEHNNVNP